MKFANLIRLSAAVAVSATLAGTATAQQGNQEAAAEPPQSPTPRLFRILDTDGDAKITMEEIKAEQGRLLRAADVDGDGKLSVTEFRRRGALIRSLRTTSLFDLLDSDGDQMVTAEELAAPSERWMKRYDSDNDGLTVEEFPGTRGKGMMKRRGARKWR